ncbi:unnamed protein product [Macrosiphum euphorbiae]|uniref:Uncharacterized protein n=1 Tax=Macrosiphum euphorbiae TaxID=13131 RepID=A0AAV0X485_9HEMI|nr:unnamed protein product [Macrosiphum euphorbiae]
MTFATVEGDETNRARVLNIIILYCPLLPYDLSRFVVGVLLACFIRRYTNHATVSYYYYAFEKIHNIFLFVRDKLSGAWAGLVVEYNHSGLWTGVVGDGAWRGDGEGLFTVKDDRLSCCRCGSLPPWSKIPMRSGDRRGV